MSILNENQKRVLSVLSEADILRDKFHLGGGTALSEFYLKHRYSEDFDFFTSEERIIVIAAGQLEKKFRSHSIPCEIKKKSETFSQFVFPFSDGSIFKLDLALEPKFRHKPVVFDNHYKFNVENITDLACNKLSALFDRFDIKDFIDIYFIDKEIMKLEELLPLAKQKHVGLEEYWLSRAMFQVEQPAFLPKMIKVITIEELKSFFLVKARQLIEKS